MRITGNRSAASQTPGKKQMIQKKIKQLEAKKKKLMEKLSELTGTDPATQQKQVSQMAQQTVQIREARANAMTSGQNEAAATQIPTARTGGTNVVKISQTPVLQMNQTQDAAAEAAAADMTPEEIMKLVLMIDVQIMELKSQLTEEDQPGLDNETEKSEASFEDATLTIAAPEAGGGEAVSMEPPVVENGHVDGYA